MPAQGAHAITSQFEQELCKYTNAPYAIALDNMSNALFLSLYYETQVLGKLYKHISIPCRTYMSVPCSIIHCGLKVKFTPVEGNTIKGPYDLSPTRVVDSALRFTANMYRRNTHMCISFTGPYKHLKLGKGGAILTDDKDFYQWAKKARFSGRDECSYHVDNFDINPVIGWNFYMMPEVAAHGILLMGQFYEQDGSKKQTKDLELPYPDLSKFEIYKQ